VNKVRKSVNICQIYGQFSTGSFCNETRVYICSPGHGTRLCSSVMWVATVSCTYPRIDGQAESSRGWLVIVKWFAHMKLLLGYKLCRHRITLLRVICHWHAEVLPCVSWSPMQALVIKELAQSVFLTGCHKRHYPSIPWSVPCFFARTILIVFSYLVFLFPYFVSWSFLCGCQ